MMMQVAAGSLAGDNPSKDGADDDDPLARLSGEIEAETPGEEAPPAAEREAPKPDAVRTGGAPARTYVILELDADDDGAEYLVEVHRVEARNAPNALRKAFKELYENDKLRDGQEEATLIAVPVSMWRPEKVRLNRRSSVSVTVGEAA